MSKKADASNVQQKHSRTFKDKWTQNIESIGYTTIPNILLENLSLLKITAPEFLTLTAILSFKWDNRCPWPSNAKIAGMANCSPETVRSHIRQLERKGILRRIPRTGETNIFDFTNLILNLEELAKSTTPSGENLSDSPDNIDLPHGLVPTTKEDTVNENSKIRHKKKSNVSDDTAEHPQVRLVYDYFIKQFGKDPEAFKLSPKRKAKIKARLKDAGYDLLVRAIDNTADIAFYRGENDRGWQADLDFIIRSYEQVERLSQLDDKQVTFKADW